MDFGGSTPGFLESSSSTVSHSALYIEALIAFLDLFLGEDSCAVDTCLTKLGWFSFYNLSVGISFSEPSGTLRNGTGVLFLPELVHE